LHFAADRLKASDEEQQALEALGLKDSAADQLYS
jgi:hypothetical protein